MNHEQNPRGGESRGTGNFKLNIDERDLATGSTMHSHTRENTRRFFRAFSLSRFLWAFSS